MKIAMEMEKVNKTRLVKVNKEMQLNKNHLSKEMKGIEAIVDYTSYSRRRAKQQNNMNYKSEYDRLIGELSQTTVTPGTRDRIERRKRDIQAAYQGRQYTNNILLP